MARDKGKKVASTSSSKGKGKEKAKEKYKNDKTIPENRAPVARPIPSNLDPKAFKLKLSTAEARRRWSHLVYLKHKHCRFLHHETTAAMGITDEVTHLMQRGGFTNIFQGNYLAYHILTVEFLSTLVVESVNQVPDVIRFQLGGQPRELTMDQLDDIIGGDKNGNYLGNHHPDLQDLWQHFVDYEEEVKKSYNPAIAKSSSIQNPTIRYFHWLISCTIHSRHDSGTFLATDAHLLWAVYRGYSQDAALYLVDHMENQAYLFAGQKIGIGAFVTPIANHFNVPIREHPVSTSIYVDRRTLELARMISYDQFGWFFKLHGLSGVRLFALPNAYYTMVMDNEYLLRGNGKMNSPGHKQLMWAEGGPRPQQGGHLGGDDKEEKEEKAEQEGEQQEEQEEDEGEGGGPQPAFQMTAQEFHEAMRGYHKENTQLFDNYHLVYREYVGEQAEGIRQEVGTLRMEVGALRNTFTTFFEKERQARELERKIREDERAYQEQYRRMMHDMHQFYPYYPEGYQRYDPNNPPPPPFP